MATTEENLAQMAGVARTDLSGTGPKGKGKGIGENHRTLIEMLAESELRFRETGC